MRDELIDEEPRLPGHETIYRRLREMILFGEVAPGQAVTIQSMRDATGAGMTPVREALRRLVAEGALEAGDNRRISVPGLTLRELDDILHARLAVEPRLARRGAPHMTKAGVETLRAWDRQVDAAIATGDVNAYMRSNYHFHFDLYAAADAELLHRIAMSLWLRIGPALRHVCGRFIVSRHADRHRDALAALEARDANAVEAAIADDIRQGVDLVRAAVA